MNKEHAFAFNELLTRLVEMRKDTRDLIECISKLEDYRGVYPTPLEAHPIEQTWNALLKMNRQVADMERNVSAFGHFHGFLVAAK